MESRVSSELDYKKQNYISPSYKFHRINPQTGGSNVTLTTGGGDETIFEIPIKCFNLAKSHLLFTIQAQISVTVNSTVNWAFVDCVAPLRQIQLYTRGNVKLCDLNEIPNYTKMVMKPETKLEEYLDYPQTQDTVINAETIGRYLTKSNAVVTSNTRSLLAPYAKRFNGTNADVNFTESRYLEPGTAGTATPLLNISIPLSTFKNTILALDKDLYLNEVIIMRLVWSGTNRIYFTTLNNTDPTSAVIAPYAQGADVSNLALYLATEENKLIVNDLKMKVAESSGMSVLIPYVYNNKWTSNNATSHSLSYRWNSGHGSRLLKIFHSAFNTAENLNTAYDHDNKGTNKVNRFYTMLDNDRLQEYDLSTSSFDDYLYLRPILKGSVIQSPDIFYHNWVWIEDWTGYCDKTVDVDNKENLVTGLSLALERKWDFYAQQVNNNVAAQYIYYTFTVTQKTLTVTSQGLTVA